MLLANKVAFITGAGSGIGKATALLFAQEGAKIVALGVDGDNLEATKKQIEETGGQALVVVADVSSPEAMQDAVKQAMDRFGQLDIVFANAGINGVWAPIEELEPQEWDKTLETNLRGTFLTLKYTYPHMKERGGAMMVTSGINGTRTFKGERIAYSCTKAGQVVLVKSLAVEFAKHNVRINAICPGAIATNHQPIHRVPRHGNRWTARGISRRPHAAQRWQGQSRRAARAISGVRRFDAHFGNRHFRGWRRNAH